MLCCVEDKRSANGTVNFCASLHHRLTLIWLIRRISQLLKVVPYYHNGEKSQVTLVDGKIYEYRAGTKLNKKSNDLKCGTVCDGKIAPVPESISNGPELITATGPGTGTGIMSTGPDNMGTTTIVSTDSTDTTTTTSTSMDSEGNMASSISIDTNTDMTTGLGSMDPAGPAHSDGGGNAL